MLRNSCIVVSRRLLGAAILAFYFLPNTSFGKISLPALVLPLVQHATPLELVIGTVVAVFALLICLSRCSVSCKDAPNRLLLLMVGIYLMPMVVSLFLPGKNPHLAEDIESMLAALTLGLSAALLAGSTLSAAISLVLVAAVQGVYAIMYQKMGTHAITSGNLLRAGGTFSSTNDLCITMMLSLPLATMVVVQEKRPVARLLYSLIASILFAALVLTWDRGAILGLSIGLGYLAFSVSRRWKFLAVIAFVLGGMIVFTFQHRTMGRTNEASAQRSTAGRYILWNQGLVQFKEHWLTGVGIGCLEMPMATATKDPALTRVRSYREPKNLVIDWLAEMGIAGGFLFLGFVFAIARVLRLGQDRSVTYALSAAWISLMVLGLVDTPFGVTERLVGTAVVGNLIGITLLLGWSARRLDEREEEYVEAI